MDKSKTLLRILLRVIGTSSLFALPFVFAPYSLMNSFHAMLGMGELSNQPIVGYLARSTSAFYALVGGLLWLVSFDLERYKKVLTYLGLSFVVFGGILLYVDWLEGLPKFWKYWEGPFVIFFGILVLMLNRTSSTK